MTDPAEQEIPDLKPGLRTPAAWMQVVAAACGIVTAVAAAESVSRQSTNVEAAGEVVRNMPLEQRAELVEKAAIFDSLPAAEREQVVELAKSIRSVDDPTLRKRLLSAAALFSQWRRGLSLNELEQLSEATFDEKKTLVSATVEKMRSLDDAPPRRGPFPPLKPEQVARIAEVLSEAAGRDPSEVTEQNAERVISGIIASVVRESDDPTDSVLEFVRPVHEEILSSSWFDSWTESRSPRFRELAAGATVFRALFDSQDRLLSRLDVTDGGIREAFESQSKEAQNELLELPVAEFQARLEELYVALQIGEQIGLSREETLQLQRVAGDIRRELSRAFFREHSDRGPRGPGGPGGFDGGRYKDDGRDRRRPD